MRPTGNCRPALEERVFDLVPWALPFPRPVILSSNSYLKFQFKFQETVFQDMTSAAIIYHARTAFRGSDCTNQKSNIAS